MKPFNLIPALIGMIGALNGALAQDLPPPPPSVGGGSYSPVCQEQLPLKVKRGGSAVATLGFGQYIRNALIDVRGYGSLSLYADGNYLAEIQTDSRRNTAVVKVERYVREFTFINKSGTQKKIMNISGMGGWWTQYGHGPIPPTCRIGRCSGWYGPLAANLGALSDSLAYLKYYVSTSESVAHLEALLLSTRSALAQVSARGDSSEVSRIAVRSVLATLEAKREYLNELGRIQALFEVIQRIQMIEAHLKKAME